MAHFFWSTPRLPKMLVRCRFGADVSEVSAGSGPPYICWFSGVVGVLAEPLEERKVARRVDKVVAIEGVFPCAWAVGANGAESSVGRGSWSPEELVESEMRPRHCSRERHAKMLTC